MRIIGIILLSLLLLFLIIILLVSLYVMLTRLIKRDPLNYSLPYKRNPSSGYNSFSIKDDEREEEFDQENPVFEEGEYYQVKIEVPDPESATPYEFYRFLELYPKEIIDRWYQDYKHEYKFPEEFIKNIHLKVWNDNYINPIKEQDR